MIKKEHLKAIIWPRKISQSNGKTVYQYTIVGQLITDRPIVELPGYQALLDGSSYGLADVLANTYQREPQQMVGDATDVLLNLGNL